ncbi:MAG: O-antigen ligase family protein [Candidatus Brocadia sp.]
MHKHITYYTSLISEYAFIAYFFTFSFFPFSADIFKLLCLLTVIGCWTARMLSEKKILFIKTSLNIPILSFLLCSLMTSFHSVHIQYSLGTIFHDYLTYFILFFCMVNTIQSLEQIKRIVKAMLITCGLVCAYGVYGYYTGVVIRDERLVATFEYHSRIAKYISLLLPIAVCLFFYYKNIVSRLYLSILIFVCSLSLILTMNRTSWVAILVTIFFIGFAAQKKYLIYILIGMCALGIFILPSKFITQVKTITQVNKFFTSEEILGERLLCWKASIAIMKDHPVLGIGPGKKNFRNVYQQYAEKIRNTEKQPKNEAVEQSQGKKVKRKTKIKGIERLSHPHNVFLHLLVGSGIIGLLAFLWLFTAVFYAAIRSWRLSRSEYEKALLMGITAGLVSIFLHSFTDSFWKKPDAVFLWFIIGILFTVIHNTINCKQVDYR